MTGSIPSAINIAMITRCPTCTVWRALVTPDGDSALELFLLEAANSIAIAIGRILSKGCCKRNEGGDCGVCRCRPYLCATELAWLARPQVQYRGARWCAKRTHLARHMHVHTAVMMVSHVARSAHMAPGVELAALS